MASARPESRYGCDVDGPSRPLATSRRKIDVCRIAVNGARKPKSRRGAGGILWA
jgi:hypothetical protein